MQKRLIITFLTLLLMTGAGVLAVTFAPKKENKKEAAGKNTLETSAKPAEKEQIQEQIKEPVPEQKEETEDVRSTVLAQ